MDAIFPWGIENFSSYLPVDSYYLNKSIKVEEYFFHSFGTKLTAANLSTVSRMLEARYEKENSLKAFDWKSIYYILPDQNILFLSGGVDLFDKTLTSSFKSYDLIIIHEPYSLLDQLKEGDYESDISSISPNLILYNTQATHIQNLSKEKKRIGLHIRNGDYKAWQNGIYFYSNEFWVRKASEYLDLGHAVWIFSNELDDSLCAQLKNLGAIFSQESFEVDFVRLMLMDEVIAPPSTFSTMAVKISRQSFSNDIQLTHLDPLC
jgi:hypothetical protein